MTVAESAVQWELQAFDGVIMGPYNSSQLQQAFLQGKLCLGSLVRMVGHSAFKPLMAYWHILDDSLSQGKKADAAKRAAAAAAAAAAAVAAAAAKRRAAGASEQPMPPAAVEQPAASSASSVHGEANV